MIKDSQRLAHLALRWMDRVEDDVRNTRHFFQMREYLMEEMMHVCASLVCMELHPDVLQKKLLFTVFFINTNIVHPRETAAGKSVS